MIELAFTGPSSLSILDGEEARCRAILRDLRRRAGLVTWRSGGAFGLDTLVVEESGAQQDVHLIYPDGERWNEALLDEYDFMGLVTPVPGGYRRRNEVLVTGADHLHAFVRSLTFYRSGEWMTINIARRLGVEHTLHLIT